MTDQPSGVALRLVHDFQPGLRRVRTGAGVAYLDQDGAQVEDPAVLDRIRRLAIQAIGNTTDPWQKAVKINHWVAENLRDKNFTMAFASASEVTP